MPVVNPDAPVPPVPGPGAAPCNWSVDVSCCSDWNNYPQVVRDRATSWASQILWAMTGRQFGACPVTIRPCGSTCNFYGGWLAFPVIADGIGQPGTWQPFIRGGTWYNCGCTGACSCEARCQVWLPGPVASVAEVIVDGIVLPDTAYRVDNRSQLVRIDGECWPECQDLNLESPAEGTFEVTYFRGRPLPVAGQIAAGLLACEFAKACTGGDCRLPGNLSSLARQGIEVTMVDPTDALNDGLTGIPNVDLWIRSVNPGKLIGRPRVFSLDVPVPPMRTS